jgi:hypothetical protein
MSEGKESSASEAAGFEIASLSPRLLFTLAAD